MKSFVIFFLLLIWHSAAFADESIDLKSLDSSDFKFNSRLLAMNVTSEGNPVDAARQLIFDLGQFSLIGEVVQAKFINHKEGNWLLFEMSNALQAKNVFLSDAYDIEKSTKRITYTNRDFYDNQISFRTLVKQ